jgi:hypothetical protein
MVAVAILTACSAGCATSARSDDDARARALAAARGPGTAGLSPGYRIYHLDADDLARQLDLDVAAGAHWLRLDLDWPAVEPVQGQPDWSGPDRVIEGAVARGLDVIAVPTGAPGWARETGRPSAGQPVAGSFADFVSRGVARYAPRGVHTWEVWNEPNLRTFWGAAPDGRRYAQVLAAAAAAAHAADAGAYVVSGGLAPVPDAAGLRVAALPFVRTVLAAGGLDGVDAVAIHPYTYPAMPSLRRDGGLDGMVTMAAVHDLLSRAGRPQLPVWATEFGAPTGTGPRAVTLLEQARAVSAAFALVRRWPWAGPLVVYSDRDAGDDPASVEDNFGLLDLRWTPKPAWSAFRDAAGS